jgi:hypothetical protein
LASTRGGGAPRGGVGGNVDFTGEPETDTPTPFADEKLAVFP